MLIRLTRLTNERHRFEIVRDDGTRESHELETRSTMLHDLAHYAVETEAGLGDSFYGRLAQGVAYEDLTVVPPTTPEVMQTEVVVALIQNTFKDGRSPRTDAEPPSSTPDLRSRLASTSTPRRTISAMFTGS